VLEQITNVIAGEPFTFSRGENIDTDRAVRRRSMVFGQNRQKDLIDYLLTRTPEDERAGIDWGVIDTFLVLTVFLVSHGNFLSFQFETRGETSSR